MGHCAAGPGTGPRAAPAHRCRQRCPYVARAAHVVGAREDVLLTAAAADAWRSVVAAHLAAVHAMVLRQGVAVFAATAICARGIIDMVDRAAKAAWCAGLARRAARTGGDPTVLRAPHAPGWCRRCAALHGISTRAPSPPPVAGTSRNS